MTIAVDLDGTIVKHNGYKIDGVDTFLDGAREFLLGIPDTDRIIFLTSREDWCMEATERFLKDAGIRYDHIINNLPYGERILVNDRKPSGLRTSVAVDLDRDSFDLTYEIDGNLRCLVDLVPFLDPLHYLVLGLQEVYASVDYLDRVVAEAHVVQAEEVDDVSASPVLRGEVDDDLAHVE